MNPYLATYLAIGVCVLLALLVIGRQSDGKWPSLKNELADGSPFKPGTWKYWLEVSFLGTVLPPVLMVLGTIAWPALIFFKLHDTLAYRWRNRRKTFLIKHRDLKQQLTIQEVERVEQVAAHRAAIGA